MLAVYLALMATATMGAASAGPPAEKPPAVIGSMSITLNPPEGEPINVPLQILEGQDVAAAALAFSEQHGTLAIDTVLSLCGHLQRIVDDNNYEPPKERLRTAGAHKKKAEESAKEGAHDDAAMHLIRALLRPGLEAETIDTLKEKFEVAIRKLRQQRKDEATEAAELAAAEARKAEVAAALEEAKARAQQVEADWTAYLDLEADRSAYLDQAGAPAAVEARASVDITLTVRSADGEPSQVVHPFRYLPSHTDSTHAAYDFCAAHGLHSADQVAKLGGMMDDHLAKVGEGGDGRMKAWMDAVDDHLERGAKYQKEGLYSEAGPHFARALRHPAFAAETLKDDDDAPSSDLYRQAREGVVAMMRSEKAAAPFLAAVRSKRWEDALKFVEAMPREARSNPRLQLLEARCNSMLGRWGNAQRAAARVVEATASYSTWERGQPRMLAVAVGSAAALELGDGKKALGFLSSVLKYDPDQSEVRKQYKQLKEVLKLLEGAEEQLVKGYNHKAVKALDLVMEKMGGMDVGSSLLRAQVLLKLCRARSSMKRHTEAMDDCQTAYTVLAEPGPGVHVQPIRVREALEARAQAHEADANYDDAVSDLRAALEMVGGGGDKGRELEEALRRVEEKQRRWKCVDPTDEKQWHDNRCGHPGDPNSGRDHKAVLELPANLDQLKRDAQCTWVNKQYRKLARVWHPDRYKGVKARAERKMRECAEAKEVLVKQLRCNEKGR